MKRNKQVHHSTALSKQKKTIKRSTVFRLSRKETSFSLGKEPKRSSRITKIENIKIDANLNVLVRNKQRNSSERQIVEYQL